MAPQRARRGTRPLVGDIVSAETETPRLVDAVAFYEPMAADYDREFDVAHRRVYDDLAWEAVLRHLPTRPATVVDAGCGTGRLAARLVALGHHVIGIEPTPSMADRAEQRLAPDAFSLQRCGIEDARMEPGCAALVMAMGSLQFTADPVASIARMATWLAPGGRLVILCDSLVGLVTELLRRGDTAQAIERATTARARWVRDGHAVEHHLLDAARLRHAMLDAGLIDIEIVGALVAFSAWGREAWTAAYDEDPGGVTGLERTLAGVAELADSGKQLLATARRADAA